MLIHHHYHSQHLLLLFDFGVFTVHGRYAYSPRWGTIYIQAARTPNSSLQTVFSASEQRVLSSLKEKNNKQTN